MKPRDPLSGLSIFLSLSETLSFSRTAEALGLSRATVSTQLRDLEDHLEVRLFQRNTRSVMLTEAGQVYMTALSGLICQAKEAENEAKAFQDGRVGTIRISVAPDLGQQYLAAIVARFLCDNPAINVHMEMSIDQVDLVEQGFDLSIRGSIGLNDNLIIRRLASCSLILCASPSYAAEIHSIQKPQDLAQHSCLHFTPLPWGRRWHFCQGEGPETAVTLTPRLETNDSIALREAARAGAGITLLPEYVVNDDIAKGMLLRVLPEWDSADLPIHAVYPANRHIATKVRHFVAVLSKELNAAFGRARAAPNED